MLFKNIDVVRLDRCLTEMITLSRSMKTFALYVDISLGQTRLFDISLAIVTETVKLCRELTDLSIKYLDTEDAFWEKLPKYDPYYPPIEPKTKEYLMETARDYRVRYIGVLNAVNNLLKEGSVVVPPRIRNIKSMLEHLISPRHYE